MKKILIHLIISILVLAHTQAFAETIEPFSCRNGLFPTQQQNLQLAKVNLAKNARLYFYDDVEGCPQQKQCKTKAYVIGGDSLIVNQVQGDWACAWFQGKKRETVGWVETKALEFAPIPSKIEQAAWLGKWHYYDNTINIKTNANKLQADGEAFWYGLVVQGERVVHTGNLGGELSITAQRAHLAEGDAKFDCATDFTLLNNYLIVADNQNCGGANVSFSGVYTKAK